jgi:uncharacterized protein YegP (UPF0339 family)
MKRVPKFVIETGNGGTFSFILKAKNGTTVLQSYRKYTDLQKCKEDIETIRVASQDEDNFRKKVASDGMYYYTLKSKPRHTIGISEKQITPSSWVSGIKSVINVAPVAILCDVFQPEDLEEDEEMTTPAQLAMNFDEPEHEEDEEDEEDDMRNITFGEITESLKDAVLEKLQKELCEIEGHNMYKLFEHDNGTSLAGVHVCSRCGFEHRWSYNYTEDEGAGE